MPSPAGLTVKLLVVLICAVTGQAAVIYGMFAPKIGQPEAHEYFGYAVVLLVIAACVTASLIGDVLRAGRGGDGQA